MISKSARGCLCVGPTLNDEGPEKRSTGQTPPTRKSQHTQLTDSLLIVHSYKVPRIKSVIWLHKIVFYFFFHCPLSMHWFVFGSRRVPRVLAWRRHLTMSAKPAISCSHLLTGSQWYTIVYRWCFIRLFLKWNVMSNILVICASILDTSYFSIWKSHCLFKWCIYNSKIHWCYALEKKKQQGNKKSL